MTSDYFNKAYTINILMHKKKKKKNYYDSYAKDLLLVF